MKILNVCISDREGGAGKASYRLHQSLQKNGVEAYMLVMNKRSGDSTVITETSRFKKILQKFLSFLDAQIVKCYPKRSKTLFSPALFGSKKIIKKINDINADIVHVHWICGGMIQLENLVKIHAPIVWSLHDMWAFTGGEHYTNGDDGYMRKSGFSTVLGSKRTYDLSWFNFRRKKRIYKKIQALYIIGLSKWITASAQKSTLLKSKKIFNIPNPIDTDRFTIFKKKTARNILQLPINKKIIAFGAVGATSDPRKGYAELYSALENIDKKEYELVVFGNTTSNNFESLKMNVHYMGVLRDETSLVLLYNAADVMIVPSLQENLSNTIMESLSCGTPVVAFDIGGNGDMVEHKKNGYLAQPFETSDLAYGIDWVLNNKEYDMLCRNARKKVLETFDSSIVAKQYIELYQHIVNTA